MKYIVGIMGLRKTFSLQSLLYSGSWLYSLLFSLFILIGCSSGYRAQPIEPPSAALEDAVQGLEDDPSFATTEYLPQDWWTIFEDDQLTEFIETALNNNPTLKTAHAKTLLAASSAQRVRAILYPQIFYGADVSRQKFSETGIIPFIAQSPSTNAATGVVSPVTPASLTPIAAPGGSAGIPVYFTQWETDLALSYDFDLWGKNRNTWAAALNEVQANLADEAFARLQLSINVARVYFKLQVDYKRQEIAQTYVENTQNIVSYYHRRIQGNLDNNLTLNSSELSLSSAKQSLLIIQGDIAVNEDQLRAYLAGSFDEEICNTHVVDSPLPKVPLPSDIPLHLISRRPDIIAQIWLIESAGKQIAVAKAGFYPDFNLAALFGFQTIHLHELFKWPSTFFNIDPAVSLPIFDGGRLIANLRGSEVNYDLAIYKYNELVLDAAKEVLDGIAVLRNADQQQQEFTKAVTYQENLLRLNDQLIAGHLNSSLNSLTTRSNVFIARDQEAIAINRTIQALLSLIKALGGGYDQKVCNE